MKYLLFLILFVVLIAYGFFYAKEHRLIKLPTPSYVACGCGGCCADTAPVMQCLYRYNGETLEDVIARDRAENESGYCMKDCSQGTEYKYCD